MLKNEHLSLIYGRNSLILQCEDPRHTEGPAAVQDWRIGDTPLAEVAAAAQKHEFEHLRESLKEFGRACAELGSNFSAKEDKPDEHTDR